MALSNEFHIDLIGSLDQPKSRDQINKDVEALERSLNSVELKTAISPNQIKSIQKQLNNLQVALKDVTISKSALNKLIRNINDTLKNLQISTINIESEKLDKIGQKMGKAISGGIKKTLEADVAKQAKKISDTATTAIVQNEKKKQNAYKASSDQAEEQLKKAEQLAQSSKQQSELKPGTSLFKDYAAKNFSFDASADTAKDAHRYFEQLLADEKAVIVTTQKFGELSELTEFTTNIKRANGEVESLRFVLDETNGQFRFAGGSANDTGIVRQVQQIENAFVDYTQKLEQFKSTNNSILSGLTAPLSTFEKKIQGLKTGATTIDDVKNSYKTLNAEASKITANFTRQLSATDHAIRNLAKGEQTIAGLKAEFKGLSNAPKEINSELNKVSRLLRNVKNIEEKEGRTANWAAEYRKWEEAIESVQAKIKTLQKEQANAASTQIFNTDDLKKNDIAYMQKVYNTIEKQMVEIQRVANAKGWKDFEVTGVEEANGKIKNLTLTVTDAEGAIKKLNFERAQLQGKGKAQAGLMQVGDVQIIKTAALAYQELAERVGNIKTLTDGGVKNDYATQIEVLSGKFRNLGLTQSDVNEQTKNVATAFAKLKNKVSNPFNENDFAEIISLNDALQKELAETANTYTRLQYSNRGFVSDQQRLAKANQIEAWNQKNTRASKETIANNEAYIASLRDLNSQMSKMRFDEINNGFKQNENAMRGLGKLGKSLKEQFKQAAESFGQWLTVSQAVMHVVSSAKNAVVELKEVNTIITEISKTSNLTKQQLTELGDASFETASKYGRTATDYLTGVQEMYRAGFQNAAGMAELSILAQAAGDMESDAANDYLITTNAAYNLKGNIEDLNAILDSQNYITNNAAVSMQDMADATSEAASIAAQYGVEVDELSALIAVAASKTRESGSEVGTALKSIFVNLQDTTSKPIAAAFEAVGISMTEMVNGSEKLKTPIELLKELSVAFTSLEEGDTKRANILNDIGGKYHANTLAAVLSDIDAYNSMLDLYSQGAGSASIESQKTAQNWESALIRIKNTWTDTIGNIVNSDFIIELLNQLNSLLSGINQITDALGEFGSIGIGAGIWGATRLSKKGLD